jgi:hypothetical protein
MSAFPPEMEKAAAAFSPMQPFLNSQFNGIALRWVKMQIYSFCNQ